MPTQPIVDPKVGNDVSHREDKRAVLHADRRQSKSRRKETDIAQHDQVAVFLIIDRAVWVEMVDFTAKSIPLTDTAAVGSVFVVIVAGDVCGNVHDPAQCLLSEQRYCGHYWGLLPNLRHFVYQSADPGCILVPSYWYKDLVTFEMACRLVMLAVRDLPGEVRDTECGMQNETDSIVQRLRFGKCLVATFVSNDPHARHDEALDDGEDSPEGCESKSRLHARGQDIAEQRPIGCGLKEVSGNICQATRSRADEAVLGYGSSDLVDGDVGDLELVPVRIQQDAMTRWLQVSLGKISLQSLSAHGRGRRRTRSNGREFGI